MHSGRLLPRIALGLIALGSHSLAAPPSPESRYKLVLQAPPAASVNSVAVSPDGSLVAIGASEGGVRLHDAATGAMLRVIDDVGDRTVVFSPDGHTLAAGGYHMDKRIGICDVRTGQRVHSLPGHTEWEVYATAFSPDGKLLASSGVDKQVLVWEVATGTLRHRFASQQFPVTTLAFSPDGSTLAGGGGDRTIRLWDAMTGHLRRTLAGHRDWVCAVAFSPDGRTIASASCDWASHRGHDWPHPAGSGPEQSEWRLWDAASGDLQRTVTVPGRLLSLAFAPDGQSLACAIGTDVRLYDLASEAPGRIVTSHDFGVTSVTFTRDGSAILSGSHDHTARRVLLATGEVQWQAPGYHEQVNSVALSPDGALLATGSSDIRFAQRKPGAKQLGPGALRLWDTRTGRWLRRLGDPAEQVMAVAFAPGDTRLASGGRSADGHGVVHVWDAATGQPVWSRHDHAAEVLAVAFAPDGSSLASAGAEGTIQLRDARTGSSLRSLEGHDGGATSLDFSPDGTILACGEARGGTRLWDVRTGRLLHTCKAGTSQAGSVKTDRIITSVVFSPDGGALMACAASVGNAYDDPVRLWDTRTGELKREFTEPRIGGRPIALSPDGSILAAGGKTIQLWDARNGEKLHRLTGHLKKIQSIAFSPDGRLIVGGGSYGTTNIWEVATGRHLVTLFAFPNDRASDDWLAYHPDGFYHGSPAIGRYLAWRVGEALVTPESPDAPHPSPSRLESALKLLPPDPTKP